jgi:hypothetical protein
MSAVQRLALSDLRLAAVLLLTRSESLSAIGALNEVTDAAAIPAEGARYLTALGALVHVVHNVDDGRLSKLATPGIAAAETPIHDAIAFLEGTLA